MFSEYKIRKGETLQGMVVEYFYVINGNETNGESSRYQD